MPAIVYNQPNGVNLDKGNKPQAPSQVPMAG